jgi:hypothetical protein
MVIMVAPESSFSSASVSDVKENWMEKKKQVIHLDLALKYIQ